MLAPGPGQSLRPLEDGHELYRTGILEGERSRQVKDADGGDGDSGDVRGLVCG